MGHISSTKTLDLCKDHYQQPEVWQPLYDVVFGEYVKQTKAENPTKTKRKAKKKLMKNRVINL